MTDVEGNTMPLLYSRQLHALADLLDALPDDDTRFNMGHFAFSRGGRWMEEYTDEGRRQLHDLLENGCGTSACAGGWAWAFAEELGMPILASPIDLADLLVEDSPLDWMDSWSWTWSASWPNDPHLAATRIRFLADHGSPPESWDGHYTTESAIEAMGAAA